MSDSEKPKLYNAWFCPFAQRAWISMLHKGVDFEYVEQNPFEKSPEWLAVNPRGLAPAVVHNGHSVYDSTICIEYIDETWRNEPALMPTDTFDRAYVRIWVDHVNSKIVPHFYGCLLRKTEEERNKAKADLLQGIEQWLDAMRPGGPFFMGSQFTMADIVLAPFINRFVLLKQLRSFEVPPDGKFARFGSWWETVKEMDCVKKTLQGLDNLLKFYEPFAAGATTSELAEAVRQANVVIS